MTATTKSRRPAPRSASVTEAIRSVIAARRLTAYAVARAAGLDPSVVSRFLARERGLTGDSLDAIAGALGLRLAEGRGGLR